MLLRNESHERNRDGGEAFDQAIESFGIAVVWTERDRPADAWVECAHWGERVGEVEFVRNFGAIAGRSYRTADAGDGNGWGWGMALEGRKCAL